MRYETSKNPSDATEANASLSSISEYLDRQDLKDVKHVFYLITSNRSTADTSPYVEPFKKHGIEVIYMYDPRDEYVVRALDNVDGYKLIAVDSIEAAEFVSSLDPIDQTNALNESDVNETKNALTQEQVDDLIAELTVTFGSQVKEIHASKHSTSHPMLITGHESAAQRGLMRALAGQSGMPEIPMAPVRVDINPQHPVILELYQAYKSKSDIAEMLANQLLDNAKIAAGVLDDARPMVGRLNTLIEHLLKKKQSSPQSQENGVIKRENEPQAHDS